MERLKVVWTNGTLVVTLEAHNLNVCHKGRNEIETVIERTRTVVRQDVAIASLNTVVNDVLIEIRADLICLEGALEEAVRRRAEALGKTQARLAREREEKSNGK